MPLGVRISYLGHPDVSVISEGSWEDVLASYDRYGVVTLVPKGEHGILLQQCAQARLSLCLEALQEIERFSNEVAAHSAYSSFHGLLQTGLPRGKSQEDRTNKALDKWATLLGDKAIPLKTALDDMMQPVNAQLSVAQLSGDFSLQKLRNRVLKNSEVLSGKVRNIKTFESLASSAEKVECYKDLVHLLDSRSASEPWSERYAKMQQGFLKCLGPFVTRGSRKQVKSESFMMAYSAVKQIPHHEGLQNDLAVIITLDEKSRSTEYITKEEMTQLSGLDPQELWKFEGINALPAMETGGRAQSETLR